MENSEWTSSSVGSVDLDVKNFNTCTLMAHPTDNYNPCGEEPLASWVFFVTFNSIDALQYCMS